MYKGSKLHNDSFPHAHSYKSKLRLQSYHPFHLCVYVHTQVKHLLTQQVLDMNKWSN